MRRRNLVVDQHRHKRQREQVLVKSQQQHSNSNNNERDIMIKMKTLLLIAFTVVALLPNTANAANDTNDTTWPHYACETAIWEPLLGSLSSYRKSILPIVSGDYLDVHIQMRVQSMHISNYGVNGGDVDVFGMLSLRWTDERLAFRNPPPCNITTMYLPPQDIWTPSLAEELFPNGDDNDNDEWPRVSLEPNGTVSWDKLGTLRLHCQPRDDGLLADPGKTCALELVEESDGVRYVSQGILVESFNVTLPEYSVNTNVSRFSVDGQVRLELDFNPLRNDCNLCGHSDGVLRDVENHFFPQSWLRLFPHTSEWNCTQLDAMMQTLNVSDETCLLGRAFFEESCCDDTRASFECERNIHQQLDDRNTITPPNPSARENDNNFASEDKVDIQVQLDLIHFLGIDVQMNTMKVLVTLELAWYDENLAWHPFIGGCHRVSYRASLDAEQTEIWVPEIELVNLVEGVNKLPDDHASVRYDGLVTWSRTGVLTATCDLLGIENFPFDETSCSLQFGGTRDPLYHRMNYVPPQFVQFGSQLADDAWNYQEYKILTSKTIISTKVDRLSGYENQVVKFQFFFQRARGFYMNLFVILYVIFTYLAFGMFFINYQVGERLGYGSSILFVIVAQDITLSSSTPVTQEYLWIYKLSFGCKMFIVYAIVHSIIVLHLYARALEREEEAIAVGEDGSLEERRPFMEEDNGAASEDEDEDEENAGSDLSLEDESLPKSDHGSLEKTLDANETCTPFGQRREKMTQKVSRACSKTYSQFCCVDKEAIEGKRRFTVGFLRVLDFRIAVGCILVYSLFLVVMFVTVLG